MRCRIARRKWIDVDLALASREVIAAESAHISQCDACRDWARRERSLTTDLGSLRVELPFAVDVRARVAARIADHRPVQSVPVSAPKLAWAMSCAIVVGLALLTGAWIALPDLGSTGSDARALASGLGKALAGLGAPLMASAGVFARLLASISALGRAVADTLHILQPVAIATVVSCTVMMAGAIALVLSRDLRRPGWIKEDSR